VLVEFNSDTQEFINAMRQLHLLAYAAAEKNLTFYIRSFKSIQDYIHQFPDETVHIAHAIDMVSLPVDDLFAVYTCLVEKGFFYIADRFHDFIMTRDKVSFSSRYQANLSPRYTREMDEKTYAQAIVDYDNLKIKQTLAPYFENKKMIINEVLSFAGLFSAKEPSLQLSPTARTGERVLQADSDYKVILGIC
jgi:hypothetical protein